MSGIGKAEWAKVWDDRAKRMGPQAVGHVAWGAAEFDASTGDWWADIWKAACAGGTSIGHVLDYGCGIGRFSLRWSRVTSAVTGVDVSPTMLKMARERAAGSDLISPDDDDPCDLQFKLIEPGAPIPLEDNSVGVVFTCTVLQHVPDAEFAAVVAELRRVLKPGGLVVLFENIHAHHSRTSGSGHVVFRKAAEYEAAFPGIVARSQRVVKRETHCTFSGRVE